MQSPNSVRFTVVLICAAVTLAALVLLFTLTTTVVTTSIAFDNDEANHAIDGWEVSVAIRDLSPTALWQAITDQGFYPPVHSLFVTTSYLLVGPSLVSSRLPTVFLFGLTLVGLAWITFRIASRNAFDDGHGETGTGAVLSALRRAWLPAAGAAFAVAFAITSEVFISLSVLVMLEMTGACLTILLLLASDQVDGVHSSRSRWFWVAATGLTAMAVTLTKYSFGLFVLPALIAGLLTASWPWKASRRAWMEALAVSGIFVGISMLWILVTDRETLWLFFFDHRSDAPILSAANLLYLPRLWFRDYSPSVVVAIIVAILAIVGALRAWRRLAVRVAIWSILVALTILTISTTNEPRHFLPVAPAIWMLSGLGLVELWRWLQAWAHGSAMIIVSMTLLLLLLVVSGVGPALALQSTLVEAFEGEPDFVAVQDHALQAVDLDQPLLFIGDFDDQNGLLAMRWQAATLLDRSTWDLDIDFFPYEQYGHSIDRTNRKPQIVATDPGFPHTYMNEVLDQDHYPTVIEIKHIDNYYGPRAANPDDPLCAYPAVATQIGAWNVTLYETSSANKTECTGD